MFTLQSADVKMLTHATHVFVRALIRPTTPVAFCHTKIICTQAVTMRNTRNNKTHNEKINENQ